MGQLGGRLLVSTDDGQIVTMLADGSDRVVLDRSAGGTRMVVQPTWSPDGTSVAWSAIGLEPSSDASLVTASDRGERRVTTPVMFPAFYLCWRPDAGAVACLGNGPLGIELTVVEPGEPPQLRARGAPLFFSWAPEEDDLVAHIGDDRLDLVGRAASPRPLATPARFSVPAWHPRRSCIVAAVTDAGTDQLALMGLDGSLNELVAVFEGFARFVLSPDGTRLAYVCEPLNGGPALASLDNPTSAIPGHLVVVELGSGVVDIVWAQPPVAFCWSPDSSRLLLCSPRPDRGRRSLEWRLWAGSYDTIPGPVHVPAPYTARHYLPFAEQYTRSQTSWAPDSSAFAYAARSPQGVDQIWVQEVGDPAPAPRRVTDGVAVSWSPRTSR